jgi:putative hydrolase of the HAD superfamily
MFGAALELSDIRCESKRNTVSRTRPGPPRSGCQESRLSTIFRVMSAHRPIDLVLVDFDDTLVHTAPRFAAARRSLFALLEGLGFDRAMVSDVHHREVDPALRARHGFGPQRMSDVFRETYRSLCARSGEPPDPAILERAGALGAAIAGTPPAAEGAIAALRRLAAALPTVVYTQAGDTAYQVGCLREAGALGAVGEDRVRVVPVKTPETLRETLRAFQVTDPARAWMVGNSLRSDVNPALAIGARAVLVEIDDPWHHDVVEPIHNGFPRVRSFAAAVDLLLQGR